MSNIITAQKANIWGTYGQTKFVYSPGIEVNYITKKNIGLQIGSHTSLHSYDPNKITYTTDTSFFRYINSSVNFGVCGYLIKTEKQKVGGYVGVKASYGPYYQAIHKYKDYIIYTDVSNFEVDFGLDLGVFYNYKKSSFLLKYDFARNSIRVGIGVNFSLKRNKENED